MAMNRRQALAALASAPLWPWLGSATAGSAPTRVYSASPVTTYLLAALAPDVLVGWNFPPPAQAKGFFTPAVLAKPVVGGFFGQGKTPNTEALLATRPELAIVSGATSVNIQESSEALARLGIPSRVIRLNSMDDYPAAIEQLGQWLGRSEAFAPKAAFCRSLLSEFAALPLPHPPPSAYYAEQADGLASECPGSLHNEVPDRLRLRNPVQCPGGQHNGFGMVRISAETLLAANPDWIITQDMAAYQAFTQQPRWQGLRAVQDRQVLLAPQQPFRWLDRPPSIVRLIAVFWLYDRLYPGHHRFDLTELTQKFFQVLFNASLSKAAIESLLNPENRLHAPG
ncbi:ABC transporter substrate-binding protein [Halothiobacillus sp. DCM-1]|uniref:ABC transporter substrate-binding protein n=1 Tax=Halothiobacillus sp. DCM-1 TaxID=3112558 RepID=UPI0032454536